VIEGKTVFHDVARLLLSKNGSANKALVVAEELRHGGITNHDHSFWRAVVGILNRVKTAETRNEGD